MNGAESLVRSLLEAASHVFRQSRHIGDAFRRRARSVPGMRCVLGLFEGVVSGAADGYARMAGKPAATLLHCGPASRTAWPICTMLAAPRRRSSTSSATRRPTIARLMRR